MEAVKNGSEDPGYDATISFDQNANAEEIVGYYLVLHSEDPFRIWLNNVEGIELSEQDKEVTKILGNLYLKNNKLFDTDMNKEKIIQQMEALIDIEQDDSVAEQVSTRIWNKAIRASIDIVKKGGINSGL